MEKHRIIYPAGPSITQHEIDIVTKAVTDAWYEGAYAYIHDFEEAVSGYVGRKYALATPSGTSAIHLSLLANGIGPGDEVIIPDFTWVGTSAPVSYVGATPVLVDIERDTWCVSAERVREHITPRTKAIYTVDMYGNMPDYDEIEKIAEEYGLLILEDSAQAIGCEYKKKRAGSFGKTSIFSFHGTKMLTTNEGGMLLTDDEKVFTRAQKLANCGRDADSDRMFWFDEIGWKYKYTSMQAALGLAQLDRIDELIAKRREIFRWYSEELSHVPGIHLNTPGADVSSTYYLTTAIFDPAVYRMDKEDVTRNFAKYDIICRPVVYQLSAMPAYSFLRQEWENPVAAEYARMGINLPTPHILTRDDAHFVAEVLKNFLNERRI